MRQPIIYLSRSQFIEGFDDVRRPWIVKRHAPDLMMIGFLSARAFYGKQEPQSCNVYELEDNNHFNKPEYTSYRQADPFVQVSLNSCIFHSKSMYEQVIVADRIGQELDPIPPLSGSALSLLYFDHSDEDAVLQWFRQSVCGNPALNAPSVRSLRLWDHRYDHPTLPKIEPKWVGAIEWYDGADDDTSTLAGAIASLPGADVVRNEFTRKWYGITREDSFKEMRNI